MNQAICGILLRTVTLHSSLEMKKKRSFLFNKFMIKRCNVLFFAAIYCSLLLGHCINNINTIALNDGLINFKLWHTEILAHLD